MTTERRFDAGMRETETGAPGLVLGDDGVVYLIASDGTRTPVGGGGSSSYGSSYLGSFGATSIAVTGSPQAYAYDAPADLLHGSDISLSGDGKSFTINTDGWYSLLVDCGANPADNTSVGEITFMIDVAGLDSSDILSQMNGAVQLIVAVDGTVSIMNTQAQLSIPPVNFKSGDTFGLSVIAGGLAGTAPRVTSNIVIVRAA